LDPPYKPHLQRAKDKIKSLIRNDNMGRCGDLLVDTSGSTVFGWQFRPVLGESFVKGGQRMVFAQLVLPADVDERYEPRVLVQTRWRDYDPKRQVVGEIFANSCSTEINNQPIALTSPPHIHSMEIHDVGNGIIKLRAKGEFYAAGFSVQAGAATLPITTYDGTTLEVIGNARDLIQAGELTLISPTLRQTPFALPLVYNSDPFDSRDNLGNAALVLPQQDGTGIVDVLFRLSSGYRIETDGQPQPLISAGSTVFGTQETPFKKGRCDPATKVCNFRFVAQYADLKKAGTIVLDDLSREGFRERFPLTFGPTVSEVNLEGFVNHGTTEKTTQRSKHAHSARVSSAASEPLVVVVKDSNLDLVANSCSSADHPAIQFCADVKAGKYDLLFDKTHSSTSVARFFLKDPQATKLPADSSDLQPLNMTVKLRRHPRAQATTEATTEWPLDVASSDTKEDVLQISPAILYVGDSRTVTLTGKDFSDDNITSVKFEDLTLPAETQDKGTKLAFRVPQEITATQGAKEFALVDSSNKVQGRFTIIISKR